VSHTYKRKNPTRNIVIISCSSASLFRYAFIYLSKLEMAFNTTGLFHIMEYGRQTEFVTALKYHAMKK